MNKKPTQSTPKFFIQILTNFVLPIFVLTRLSSEAKLGPVKALIVALFFPILYELYNIVKNKKVSITSVIVIVGLLITGLLGLLHISSFWLAVRRAVPYMFIAVIILGSHSLNRSLMVTFLHKILNLKKIKKAASLKGNTAGLKKLYSLVTYFAALLFITVSVVNFITTRSVVTAPAQSAQFNEQLGVLRIYSLLAVTAPLLVGSVGIMFFLFLRLEKLTGLELDELTNGA